MVVALASNASDAFQGAQLAQKEIVQDCSKINFLIPEQSSHDGDYKDQNQQDIDEYDLNVCDEVQPPKVSKIEAMAREAAVFVIMRLISAREMASVYYKDIKNALHRWFNGSVKA